MARFRPFHPYLPAPRHLKLKIFGILVESLSSRELRSSTSRHISCSSSPRIQSIQVTAAQNPLQLTWSQLLLSSGTDDRICSSSLLSRETDLSKSLDSILSLSPSSHRPRIAENAPFRFSIDGLNALQVTRECQKLGALIVVLRFPRLKHPTNVAV